MRNPVPEVDIAQTERLVADGAVLLDVREDDEWQAGHAPDALHVVLGTLPANPPPEGRRVAVICRSGGRSAQATAALVQWGYDAVNVAGGMKAWAAAGLPVVTDDQGPGRVI